MPPAGSTTMVEPLNGNNRRQPIRNTRTQPPKYAFPGGRAPSGRASLGGAEERSQTTTDPGFFPGLTHFSDAMAALPKEMSRHFTMLKEVDAKICHPEVALEHMARSLNAAAVPVRFTEASRRMEIASQINSGVNSAAVSVNGAASVPMAPVHSQMSHMSQATSIDNYDIPRRQEFLSLRRLMNDMLPILEEKNHVIATATDALSKQLARAESSWPEIEKEIGEETRLGNLNHWAYTDRTTEKKDARAERPRREAAVHHNFAAVDDFGAVRGTHRRRAQQAQIESEIEETRANKRGLGAGKGKKPVSNQAPAVGLGLSSGITNPKKRKVEELAAGGVEMAKSLSGVFNKNGGTKGANSPRSGSPAGAKRPRTTGTALGVTAKGRARAGTGASAANSPHISSPVVGNVTTSQKPSASPALGHSTMARTASGRGRQNSTQNHATGSTSNLKQVNGVSKSLEEGSTPMSKAEIRAPRLDGTTEEATEAQVTSVSKREDSHSRSRPTPIATGTRAAGKASKNATPVNASFADALSSTSRPRSNRATGTNDSVGKVSGVGSPALGAPVKRSHKKGAGIAAQKQAELRAQQDESQSTGDGEGADEEPGDEEKKYCYCNAVSYGDMVGCDGEGCEKEWFHLGCIGLDKVPAGKGELQLFEVFDQTDMKAAKWYCRDCKKRMTGQ